MYVTISSRHCNPSAWVRERAEERVRWLARFEPELLGVELDLRVDHGVHQVDGRLVVAGARPVVARARGDGFRIALDGVVGRLRRQLTERRDRRRGRNGARPSARGAAVGGS
ncbi:MAG TPA: HPF/RaiA family ribosome-associated protein [Longimicrobiales bacterium]